MTPGSSLTEQYFDIASLFGRRTATNALAEWLTREDRPPLEEVSAVVDSPQRIHASELTDEHLGRRVSFRRAGATTAHARVAGYLSAIRTGTRANGMPGKTLVIGGVPYGPMAPHMEIIVTEQHQPNARPIRRPPKYRNGKSVA